MFIGVSAFRFYVRALINYIQSDQAHGDSTIISFFASILNYRLVLETDNSVEVAPQLASVCRYIIEH